MGGGGWGDSFLDTGIVLMVRICCVFYTGTLVGISWVAIDTHMKLLSEIWVSFVDTS